MDEHAYIEGFVKTCEARGVDPAALVKAAIPGGGINPNAQRIVLRPGQVYGPNIDIFGRNKWDRAGLPTPGGRRPRPSLLERLYKLLTGTPYRSRSEIAAMSFPERLRTLGKDTAASGKHMMSMGMGAP
jgi:hypothetical protein